MLVLNTTSPRASPAAPVAKPWYQVPSSSASTAFIRLRCPRKPVSLTFERRGDPCPLTRHHRDRGRPRLIPGQLDAHRVITDANAREQQRCDTRRDTVDPHLGTGGTRIDLQTHSGGRRTGGAGSCTSIVERDLERLRRSLRTERDRLLPSRVTRRLDHDRVGSELQVANRHWRF